MTIINETIKHSIYVNVYELILSDIFLSNVFLLVVSCFVILNVVSPSGTLIDDTTFPFK